LELERERTERNGKKREATGNNAKKRNLQTPVTLKQQSNQERKEQKLRSIKAK